MSKRVILGLVLIAAVSLAYVGYRNSQQRAMLAGYVTKGPSEPLLPAAATEHSPGSEPVQPSTAHSTEPFSDPQSAETLSSAQASDAIGPQPPNGTVFMGIGRFQIYSQGNLTWRIDTNTGRACILFATDEEWRKARVYRHGCGRSGEELFGK